MTKEFEAALEDLSAEASEQEVRDQNYRLREAKEKSDRELASARARLKLRDDALERMQAVVDLYQTETVRDPGWTRTSDLQDVEDNHGTLVAFLSDTHIGEVVVPEEMNDFNAYNLDIAEQRLQRFFERTILVARKYLHGVTYDGIVLPLGGDLVSGDIHDELVETNEVSTYESVLWLLPRLKAGIEMFAEEFGNVHVVSAPGNHGRNSKRPRHKRRSANNADTLVARLVALWLKDEEGITFDIPESFDVGFDIYGYPFSLEHGDNMKFSGTAEIGAIGPAKRGTLRAGNQASAEGTPFEYKLLGHFHQYIPTASQGFVMNGSLKGYDEYARSWHFRPERAQQALMVVTPEHGITVQAPVLVQKRSTEGW